MLPCTRTAMRTLASGVNATSRSTPAVFRPALRCVACRTLSNVFDQLRSISFCSDRALRPVLLRLIINRAYGFHSAEAALSLMLACGPVTLKLPYHTRSHPHSRQ